MIDEAISFAALAHAKQKRNYTGEPYIVHPIEVMALVHAHAKEPTEEMLLAAVLHDVVEDTVVGLDTIRRRFGFTVAVLVDQLTDEYTKEAYPDMNREARKTAEAARFVDVSPEAATVKLADLISNTRSIVEHDKGFARVYLREKRRVIFNLKHGDATLYSMAFAALEASEQLLGN